MRYNLVQTAMKCCFTCFLKLALLWVLEMWPEREFHSIIALYSTACCLKLVLVFGNAYLPLIVCVVGYEWVNVILLFLILILLCVSCVFVFLLSFIFSFLLLYYCFILFLLFSVFFHLPNGLFCSCDVVFYCVLPLLLQALSAILPVLLLWHPLLIRILCFTVCLSICFVCQSTL